MWLCLIIDHSWLLVEKHGYDPMCIPSNTYLYHSRTPRGMDFVDELRVGKALHNIRDQPSMKGKVIGKVPSGGLYIGVGEERNEEGVFVVLHKQTLHTYDIVIHSPCYLCVLLYSGSVFMDRIISIVF